MLPMYRLTQGSGPESIFIELNLLGCRASEDHGPEPAVANRQRFGPLAGGLIVPQFECGPL